MDTVSVQVIQRGRIFAGLVLAFVALGLPLPCPSAAAGADADCVYYANSTYHADSH